MNKLLCILILTPLSLSLIVSCRSKETKDPIQVDNNKTTAPYKIGQSPAMTGITLDRRMVDLKQMKGKTMLVLFHPDCDHCQREAKEIHDYIEAFNQYAIYFITTDSLPVIEKFASDYDLRNKAQVHFVQTTVQSILSNFGGVATPSIYIYSEQRLIKQFNGETPIEEVIRSLEP